MSQSLLFSFNFMSLAHCMANKLKEFIESTDSELTVIDRVRSEAMLLLFSHGECASHSQDFSKKKWYTHIR